MKKISRERLEAVAETTGFRAEVLEKVILLLSLLDGFRSHPLLNKLLVLKGGTALNMFFFNLPRLSVDIDLNYIGAVEREAMLAERPRVEEAIRATCSREGFIVHRVPEEHAGGKWLLRFESALGQGGNLQVDLNFMFRIPLWPVKTLNSHRLALTGPGTFRSSICMNLLPGNFVRFWPGNRHGTCSTAINL